MHNMFGNMIAIARSLNGPNSKFSKFIGKKLRGTASFVKVTKKAHLKIKVKGKAGLKMKVKKPKAGLKIKVKGKAGAKAKVGVKGKAKVGAKLKVKGKAGAKAKVGVKGKAKAGAKKATKKSAKKPAAKKSAKKPAAKKATKKRRTQTQAHTMDAAKYKSALKTPAGVQPDGQSDPDASTKSKAWIAASLMMLFVHFVF